jgi:hypothetical protein
LLPFALGLPFTLGLNPRFFQALSLSRSLFELTLTVRGLLALEFPSLQFCLLLSRAIGDRLLRGQAGLMTARRTQVACRLQHFAALLAFSCGRLRGRRELLHPQYAESGRSTDHDCEERDDDRDPMVLRWSRAAAVCGKHRDAEGDVTRSRGSHAVGTTSLLSNCD